MIDTNNKDSVNGALAAIMRALSSLKREIEIANIDDADDEGDLEQTDNTTVTKADYADSVDDDSIDFSDIDVEASLRKEKDEYNASHANRNENSQEEKSSTIENQKPNLSISDALWEDIVELCTVDVKSDVERGFRKPNAGLEDEEKKYKTLRAVEYEDDYIGNRKPLQIQVQYDASDSVVRYWPKLDAVLSALNQFYEDGKIEKPELQYFASDISQNPEDPNLGSGTDSFDRILGQIALDNPYSVLVLTDNDLARQAKWNKCSHVELDGGIIWFWVNGYKSKECTKYLTGRKDYNVREYNLY